MSVLDEIYDWISERAKLWGSEPSEVFQSIRTSLHFGGCIESQDFQLVTCKDCVYCDGGVLHLCAMGDGSVVTFHTCELGYGTEAPIGEVVVDEDDFCSWAERRERWVTANGLEVDA